ncbi:permease [Chloroflexota bacterium]
MDITLLILLMLVFMAIVAALWKGRWQLLILGFKQTSRLFGSMWLRLLVGFTLGGLFQVLIPTPLVAEWLGPASGLKGILIGSYASLIVGGGGPYVSLPIVASLQAAGAGVGPIIAFLVSMTLLGVRSLIVWQIPFLGARISLSWYVVCFFVTPLIGLAGGAVYELISVAY